MRIDGNDLIALLCGGLSHACASLLILTTAPLMFKGPLAWTSAAPEDLISSLLWASITMVWAVSVIWPLAAESLRSLFVVTEMVLVAVSMTSLLLPLLSMISIFSLP